MIQISKKEIPACCGKKKTVWVINSPLRKEYLTSLAQAGFSFLQTYLDAGMLYIEDANMIVSGTFGLNELKIICKNTNCHISLDKLEATISKLKSEG